VFGIGRRKSRGQLAREELNESLNHLVQAATYAANGVGATVGPRVQAARSAVSPTAAAVRGRASSGWDSTMTTFAPLAGAALDGARQAGTVARKVKPKNVRLTKKQKPRRGGLMTGLLVAGTVAGAAGAVAMRRRRQQQQWDEYSAGHSVEPARDEVDTLVVDTPEPSGRSALGGDGPVAGSAATTAALPVVDQTRPTADRIGGTVPTTSSTGAEKIGPATTTGDGVIGGGSINAPTDPTIRPAGPATARH
jgi:hypothetical protein